MSSLLRRGSSLILVSFFCAFFLLPLGVFLTQAFSSAHPVSDEFLLLAFRGLSNTIFHAAITTFLVCGGSMFFCLLFSARQKSLISTSVHEFFALFLFCLPGVAVAGAYLFFAEKIFFLPENGLFAIVICNTAINFLFVSLSMAARLRAYLSIEGKRYLELLTAIGAPGNAQFKIGIFPLLKSEAMGWAPLVFSWCFFSFAVVLMLAGSPSNSSPEVLLFSSVLQGASSERLLFLMLLYALFSFSLTAAFFNKRVRSSFSHTKREECLESTAFAWKKILVKARLVYDLGSAVFIFAMVSASGLLILNTDFSSLAAFGWAVGRSLLLACNVSVIGCLFFLLFCFCYSWLRRTAFLLSMFGGSFLLSLWSTEGLVLFDAKVSYFIVALGVLFPVFALMVRWIEERMAQLPASMFENLAAMGVKNFSLFFLYYWPALRNIFFRILSIAILWSFGDIAFSEFFFQEETLPMMARRLSLRYDFEGLAYVSFMIGFIAFLLTLLEKFFLSAKVSFNEAKKNV